MPSIVMRYLELNPLPNFILGIVMSFYFVVYFKSVGARPYIRKNGIKVNSILENAKSPVHYCLKIRTAGTKRKCYSNKKVKVFWGHRIVFFVKNRKIYFQRITIVIPIL
jgi:hypothetical protein